MFADPLAPGRYALSAGATVCVAGSDRIVRFFDYDGHDLRQFDYSSDTTVPPGSWVEQEGPRFD